MKSAILEPFASAAPQRKSGQLTATDTLNHNPNLTRRWVRHTVNISPGGDVTLRRPSGRSVGWSGGSRENPDAAAAEFLATFPGSTLVDKRKPAPPKSALTILAELIVLGCELENKERQEPDISEEMVATYHKLAEAVRLRLIFSGGREEPKYLLLEMGLPKHQLITKAQRARLIERIVRFGLSEGDTESYLLKEFEAAQDPEVSNSERRISVCPWPSHDSDGIRQKWLRVEPVIREEARRRAALRRNTGRAENESARSMGGNRAEPVPA